MMGLLDLSFIATFRQNHAVEHATMHILARRLPYLNALARSASDGFYVFGRVPTQVLADTAAEALGRLQAGETELAIHPRCGTNLVVAGLLAGLAALLAVGRSKPRLSRLPNLFMATMIAVIAAQPLGLLVQERVTTSADVSNLKIGGVTCQLLGPFTVHKVKLQHLP
jgi:ABC-type thiamin/hydroxymethylpyrimidine transport system permease subunit